MLQGLTIEAAAPRTARRPGIIVGSIRSGIAQNVRRFDLLGIGACDLDQNEVVR
jgi:hypothetical protein